MRPTIPTVIRPGVPRTADGDELVHIVASGGEQVAAFGGSPGARRRRHDLLDDVGADSIPEWPVPLIVTGVASR
jgi:hypothetical protein